MAVSNRRIPEREMFSFLEDTAAVFSRLQSFLEQGERVIRDAGSRKRYSRDEITLAQMKQAAQEHPDERHVRRMLASLEDMARHSRRIRAVLKRHGASQGETLRKMAYTLQDHGRMEANVDTLLVEAGKIEEKRLRGAIEERLTAIKRMLDEMSILKSAQSDMQTWNHLKEDPASLAARVRAYLEGGKLGGGKETPGLKGFHDGDLERQLYGDTQVREFVSSGSKFSALQKQDQLLQQWMQRIQSDMGPDGQWRQDQETAKFVKGLARHAREMERAGNKPLADYLLKNQRLGEQPDKWLELLRQARQSVWQGKQMLRQNHALTTASAQRSLWSLFGNREQALEEMLESRRQELLSVIRLNAGALPEQLIKDLEQAMERAWEERERQLTVLHRRARARAHAVMEEIRQFIGPLLPEETMQEAARDAQKIVSLAAHRQKLLGGTRPTSAQLPKLLQLASSFAESDAARIHLREASQRFDEKARAAPTRDFRQLQVDAANAINRYVAIMRRMHQRLYVDQLMGDLNRMLVAYRQRHAVPVNLIFDSADSDQVARDPSRNSGREAA